MALAFPRELLAAASRELELANACGLYRRRGAVTGAVTHAEGHLQGDMQYMQGAPCAAVAVLSAHPSTATTTTTSSWQGPNKDEGGALL